MARLWRLMSRLSKLYDQTFQTQTFQTQTFCIVLDFPGSDRQFGSRSGCGATQCATFVWTFHTQTLGATMQFGSIAGCDTTHGATFATHSATFCPGFPHSKKSGKSRRLHVGPKIWKWQILSAPFPELLWKVAPSPWSRKSPRLHLGRKKTINFIWIAPSPP